MRSLFLLLFISASAFADDAAWLRCRNISADAARLACYDGVKVVVAPTVTAPTTKTAPTVSAAAATIVVVTAPPVSQATVDAGSQNAAPPPTTAISVFGMENRRARVELKSIESELVEDLDGWSSNSRIRLANGQVWQIADESSRSVSLKSKNVLVRRGALGAFYLEFDGTNHSPRVRRIQ